MSEALDDDRNLLFGVFALQLEYIDESQFVDACAVWAMRRDNPLADLLVSRGWLTAEDRQQVDKLIERKLKKNGGDAKKTLGAVADASARSVMRNVDDPVIRKSLTSLPPAAGYVLVETLVRPTEHRSRYQLSRLHSEGGLGKVWLVRDSDLNREVALKEIQPSQATDTEACRRFVREAQVTGQLEHPNIVPVYELSRRPEDDQPFYTMRFIRGQTLRDAIMDFHKTKGNQGADPLERLKLLQAFVSVCQAVGYAHSRGVIHRDLKPDNVVMGAFGEVILLDWGLAKMVDRPGEDDHFPTVEITDEAKVDATHAGRQLGTPAYMAPEQAEGRLDLIDHRTDIYGLGSILFEILTGRPPHVGQSVTYVLRQIITGTTPHARSITPKVPAALDAICAKAMDKQRSNRYTKASELADEVQRWLANEPVAAYREPFTVRAVRFAKRHRTVVTSVSLLLLTSIPILATSSLMIANEQRQTAKNFKYACDAVDKFLTTVADVELADVPQLEGRRKALLESARDFYIKVFRDNPTTSRSVQYEAGRANGRLGDIAEILGDQKEAEEAYHRSIDALEVIIQANPTDPSSTFELARSKLGLGTLLKRSHRFRESEVTFRDSLELWDQLIKQNPARVDMDSWRNKTTYLLGATLAKLEGRRSENEELYAAAIKSQEAVIAKNPEPDQIALYARQLNNLGILQFSMGRKTDAEESFRKAVGIYEKLESDGFSAPSYRYRLANSYENLAQLHFRDPNQTEEVEKLLRKSQTLMLQLVGDFPSIPDYLQDLSRVGKSLADLLLSRFEGENPPPEAVKEISKLLLAAQNYQERLVATMPNSPSYQANLASTLASLGHLRIWTDRKLAKELFDRSIQVHEQLVADFPNVPEYRFALGESLAGLSRASGMMKDIGQAKEQIEKAIGLHEKAWEADPRNVRYPQSLEEDYALLADVHFELGNADEAVKAADRLAKVRPGNHASHFEAAKIYVESIDAMRGESLPEGVKQERRKSYSDKALEALGNAFGSGSTLDPQLLKDKIFDPIRDQEAFKALIEDISKRMKVKLG